MQTVVFVLALLSPCATQSSRPCSLQDKIRTVLPRDWPIDQHNNTVRLRWDHNTQTYIISVAHWEPSKGDKVLELISPHGRTGNQMKQCIGAVFEGMMCQAVVRCDALQRRSWNVYGIKYIDARMSARHRNCREWVFKEIIRHKQSTYWVEIPKEEKEAFTNVRTAIGRAILGYFGALRRGIVFGKRCDSMLQTDQMLVGHVRGGDLFIKGNVTQFKDSPKVPRSVLRRKGQPPLRFFTNIARMYNASRIYGQDERNPVVGALHNMSKRGDATLGTKLEVRVSRPLDEVMSDLLCASNVVMSHLSSMFMVIGASWNLRKFYLSGCDKLDKYMPAPASATYVLAVDNYTVFEHWDLTDAQLAEMVDERRAIVAEEPRQCFRCAAFPRGNNTSQSPPVDALRVQKTSAAEQRIRKTNQHRTQSMVPHAANATKRKRIPAKQPCDATRQAGHVPCPKGKEATAAR